MKLILCTTSITRGDFHRKTIGKIYNLFKTSLELFETGAVIAAQDMGAAGLTSSTTEIALKGNMGMLIHISKIPLREENMEPWEILISESQERMIFVLDDDKVNGEVD